jgi:hypothetical protein
VPAGGLPIGDAMLARRSRSNCSRSMLSAQQISSLRGTRPTRPTIFGRL